MANNWGADLVMSKGKLNACRDTFHGFDANIRASVPGYCIDKLVASGSDANEYAIDRLTEKDLSTLLIGMGSYVGGTETLQPYSSSGFSSHGQLIFPKPPDYSGFISNVCKRQTIALPYYVPHIDMDTDDLLLLEQMCLRALHRKLLIAQLSGKPFRVMLIEYILGGNGGELSEHFLISLGRLLEKFKIDVIADEVLTAGRVGPSTMTMTTGLPSSFSNLVKFITIGKFTGCGIVLKRAPRKPLELIENSRGTTTHFPIGNACMYWTTAVAHVNAGGITSRRNNVLKIMGVNDSQSWGRGCLIFTSKSRPVVTRGLKNRLLPMLEPGMKIRKHSTILTSWTRSTVSQQLATTAQQWLNHMESTEKEERPFLFTLVEHIQSKKALQFRVTINDVVDGVSNENCNNITQRYLRKFCPGSQKSFKSFMQQAIKIAATNAPVCEVTGAVGLRRGRTGKRRHFSLDVDKRILGFPLSQE